MLRAHFDAAPLVDRSGLGAVLIDGAAGVIRCFGTTGEPGTSTQAEYMAARLAIEKLELSRARRPLLKGDSSSVIHGLRAPEAWEPSPDHQLRVELRSRLHALNGTVRWVSRSKNQIADWIAQRAARLEPGDELREEIEIPRHSQLMRSLTLGSASKVRERLRLEEVAAVGQQPFDWERLAQLREPADGLVRLSDEDWRLLRALLVGERYRARMEALVERHGIGLERAGEVTTSAERWWLRGLPLGLAMARALAEAGAAELADCDYTHPRRLPYFADEPDGWALPA